MGRLKYPNHFTVDSGDFFGQSGPQDSLKSAFLVQAMDKLGYDVVNIGERELNFGQQFLLGCFKKTKMDLVSANLVYQGDGRPFAKPYVIRKVGNVRVAFFGLLGKDLKLRQLPSERALEIRDPFQTARELVPQLRKKADIVVLLSHVGLTDGQRLTLEVPGIDVMIFGHRVGFFREVTKTNGVINVRTGERGQYLPTIHLVVQDGKVASYDGEMVDLDDKIPADDAMNAEVNAFQDMLNRRFAQAAESDARQAAAQTRAAVAGDRYLGEKNCRRCHEAEYQKVLAMPHARAFATLIKNQSDLKPECVRCHVVGYGQSGGYVSRSATPDLIDVQCESCHGMGTRHDEMTSGRMMVGPEACGQCHTPEQSPNFSYHQALEKITHWE
ncbi:MAG TPA: multiheme c-type cytochrome [Candidatus Eisenbacteria bacterium]